MRTIYFQFRSIWRKMYFLDFYLPVLCIACCLLPPLAIAFVVDIFQAADMLQIVVPLLFLMVMLFIWMSTTVMVFIVLMVIFSIIAVITSNFWLELIATCLRLISSCVLQSQGQRVSYSLWLYFYQDTPDFQTHFRCRLCPSDFQLSPSGAWTACLIFFMVISDQDTPDFQTPFRSFPCIESLCYTDSHHPRSPP